MGIKVSYKSSRSGQEEGAEVCDGAEFFAMIFDENTFSEY